MINRGRVLRGDTTLLKIVGSYVGFNLLDGILTQFGIVHCGAGELNPLFNQLLTQSWVLFWVVKMGGVLGIAFGIYYAGSYFPKAMRWLALALAIMAFGVCVYNVLFLVS